MDAVYLAEIEDAEEEKSSVHLKLVIKSAADDGESLTTIGFGNDRAAFSSTAVIGVKPVDDVTHLVRKKRKPEEDAGADDTKKVKTDGREIDEPAKQTEVTEADTKSEVTGSEQNGCSAAVNGTAANHREVSGCSDGMDVADETEIKVKSVADCTTTAADELVAME